MGTERLCDGNGALLPYNQIIAPILSERLYGSIGEKSIEFFPKKSIEYFPKVYRVFSDSTIKTHRSLPSSAPNIPYKHSRFLPSATPFPSYKRFVAIYPLLRYVGRNICEGGQLLGGSLGEMGVEYVLVRFSSGKSGEGAYMQGGGTVGGRAVVALRTSELIGINLS